MPNIYTHSRFILDIYEKLDIETKFFLVDQKQKLTTFAQSIDPLFLYDVKKIKKTSRLRNFAHYFHKNKSNLFFTNLINYIKYNNLEHDPEIISFLYGFISHYILDSTFHPYVIYKTGKYNKEDKNTYKYKGKHHLMETYIDKYYISIREKINPNTYKIYDLLYTKTFSTELNQMIDIVFKETYNVNNMSKFYNKSINDMKFLYKHLRYDPKGIKEKVYKIIYKLTPRDIPTDIRYISYHYTEKGLSKYLNLEHRIWNYPTHKSKKYNYSINDLYLKSLFKCINIIKEVNNYLYNDKKVNFKSLIENLSYESGIDCEKKQELKYFEF